nr:(2Fe-2S)-binding protein [Streptomyces sp. SID3343]
MCFGVTDKQVNDRIAEGARTMREIAQSCGGAGTDCGRCVKSITAMLPRDESRRRRTPCPSAPEPVSLPMPTVLVAAETYAAAEPYAAVEPHAAPELPDNVVPLRRRGAA